MTWATHPVYSRYEVSSEGFVRLVGKEKTRRARLDKNGYWRLNIKNAGRHTTVRVHTLVAETFLGLRPTMTVNHRDGNKLNNMVGNLEWVSAEANTRHSFKAGHRINQCMPVLVAGRRFYSKREAERITQVPRWKL